MMYVCVHVRMQVCLMFDTILKFLVFSTCKLTGFILSFNSTGSRYKFTFEELLADFYTFIYFPCMSTVFSTNNNLNPYFFND